MVVVCFAVYSKSSDKLISEWIITQLDNQPCTFLEFYQGTATGELGIHQEDKMQVNGHQPKVLAAYVGVNKDEENRVQSLDMCMLDVMTVIGSYVKFIVD